ncbi:MAG: hydrogenase maturation nickel metallochaperone HypA [Pseudomonadales bacterium]|nr:hydrogenase maturation nickel metallochaperone HypA [Pseudomonadales bacterium]
MHELSLVTSLLEQVQKHAEDQPVKSITVRVGVMTCVDPGALKFCFDATKEEAGLDRCELIIDRQFADGLCRQCGKTFQLETALQPCDCGSLDIDVSGGSDLLLTELEIF